MGMSQPKKILIVDDEPLVLKAISRALYQEGLEVKTAELGEEALVDISASFYDLCFLDIYLGGVDGLAVMKKVKELYPQTRVAIMTAGQVDEDMKKTIDDGADYFIAKPFDIAQIRAIARCALRST